MKPGIFVGSLTPLAAILWRAATHGLGANPIAEALNLLGLSALIFLTASLACTALKTLLGWTWPIRVRRMVGLFAFFYALLHVFVYAGLDQGLAWRAIWSGQVSGSLPAESPPPEPVPSGTPSTT